MMESNQFVQVNVTVTLTFDLVTSKSIGVIYWLGPTCETKYEVPRHNHSLVIELKPFFQLEVTMTLTFDLVTSKSIGVICW